MKQVIQRYIDSFIDMIYPRKCAVCGCRLALEEHLVCTHCFFKMPRTFLANDPHNNLLTDNIATAVPSTVVWPLLGIHTAHRLAIWFIN